MQKESAWRKRSCEIHFFLSTRSRCIIAICPAGPPKLMKPRRTQYASASRKATARELFSWLCTAAALRFGIDASPLSDQRSARFDQEIVQLNHRGGLPPAPPSPRVLALLVRR